MEPYKVDKNGTKYYVDFRCQKCGGSGYLHGYEFIDGGRCWRCGGTGRDPTGYKWKEYTPEYQAKLDARRQKKIDKQREENLARIDEEIRYLGFDEKGYMYAVPHYRKICVYECIGHFKGYIRDCGEVGLFNQKPDVKRGWASKVVKIHKDEVVEISGMNNPYISDSKLKEVLNAKFTVTPDTSLKEGDKVELDVCFDRAFSKKSPYAYDSYINTFLMFDKDNRKYVWETSSYPFDDIINNKSDELKFVHIKAKVAYVGDKSVRLKNVKIVEEKGGKEDVRN